MQQHLQHKETGGWKTARFLLKPPVFARTGRTRPLIMGVVNLTPDSFSDGGRLLSLSAAIDHARQLLDEGADILDVGGESTRPGAPDVPVEEEWRRVRQVIDELVKWNVPLSLDSLKPEIMERALDVGVDILNDVSGFQSQKAQRLLAGSQAGAVVMHMKGSPRTMQLNPEYADCVAEVHGFLKQTLQTLAEQGVSSERVLVDPGFGFGKTLEHNIALFKAIPEFSLVGAGVLVGVSRKSMIGQLLDRKDPLQRVHGSLQAAVLAAAKGAAVLRVHDVRATLDTLIVNDSLI
jgi:dihydropteroate synthase